MTQNDSQKKYKCHFCEYETIRKYNLNRHNNTKHIDIITNKKNYCEKIHQNSEKLHQIFSCKKCNKIYKSNRYLINHEKNCNGIDELTCPRCMLSFTTKQGKSNHIKKKKCNPRSIIYAKKPNNNITNNIKNNYNIENQNNYNIENQNNYNITIHNYGRERIDYLDFEKMLEIFKKAYDIPSLLTKEIHFNINFPENNNIIDSNKKNYSLVKINDEFIYKNLNNLVIKLIEDKTTQMQKFALENKHNICLKMDTYKYEEIIELLLKLILLKEPSEQYKNQVGNIRDMIRNSNK